MTDRACSNCKNLDTDSAANGQAFCRFWERWVTFFSDCKTGYEKK